MKREKVTAIAAEYGSVPGSTWTSCHSAAARMCTKKGILHLPLLPADFELLRGKDALTVYTFGTGVAQHTFCTHCGMHAFYVPRSQPDRITVNARCLDNIDGPALKPTRFFDGRHWEEAQRKRISDGGHIAAAGLNGAVTLRSILDRAPE